MNSVDQVPRPKSIKYLDQSRSSTSTKVDQVFRPIRVKDVTLMGQGRYPQGSKALPLWVKDVTHKGHEEQGQHDAKYMRRAIELASLGQGKAHPNPMVGAVVVYRDRIIGEGYHHQWGMPHAEVMAIRSVKGEDETLLLDSTLYVSLEPCAHFGKTPPCAELIIQRQIPRVVIAQLDPYPQVAGRGVRMLLSAGIQVHIGCMEAEARELNYAFNKRHQNGRSFILLKWAESADRFMDRCRTSGDILPIVFSSRYRQRVVHRERRDNQAILIGAQTALLDDPSLTNRYWGTRQPVRIIIDPHLRLPQELKVFKDGLAPTWVLHLENTKASSINPPNTLHHVRYIALKDLSPREISEYLAGEGINSVYIEGGSKTLQTFIDEGIYDRIEYERSPMVLGEGVYAPRLLYTKS